MGSGSQFISRCEAARDQRNHRAMAPLGAVRPMIPRFARDKLKPKKKRPAISGLAGPFSIR
jgi:hypothetical protein